MKIINFDNKGGKIVLESSVVTELVDIMHRLHYGLINLSEAEHQAHELFRGVEAISDDKSFSLVFPVLVEYFFDPARKARSILRHREISRDELLEAHRFIGESKLAKMVFLSN